MATYLVSFRIHRDSAYNERWQSTVNAIQAQAKGSTTWEETTSLIILESDANPRGLIGAIAQNCSFNNFTDTLIVVDVTNNSHATYGQVQYPNTLASFFPSNALAISALGSLFAHR